VPLDARTSVTETVDGHRGVLVGLSHAIHATPELGFEEHEASARCAELLDGWGFEVTAGAAGLDTALVAEAGSGPLVVGICAEYDALPGVGHACGHNVIAAAALGAARALADVADDLGITVRLLGTPAEEGGGGKILMLERGAFDGVHAAMMVHPFPHDQAGLDCLAVAHLDVAFRGRTAHASAYPHLGRNAADALTVAQVGVGLLRQHIASTERIHGIVTHGGDAPNIVPDRAEGNWYVRAATLADLAVLYPRVRACFEAGALATGTTLEVSASSPPYSEFTADAELEALFARHAETVLGRTMRPAGDPGSTDMANVSLYVPTIHPMLGIDTDASNHQPEFAAACATPSADRAVRDGAVGMALTAIDAATDPTLRARLLAHDFVAARDYTAPDLEA
jgi:amidohydrolase